MRACVVGIAVWALGCAGGIQKTVRPPPSPLALTTVFVMPVRFGGGQPPAWRTFELSQRVVDAGLREAGDALAFYGPTEFKVVHPEVEQLWVATDALLILTGTGMRPDQGAVLRTFVDKRVASTLQEALDAKGKSKGMSSVEETTWVVRVEAVHPSSQTVLVEVSGQVTVDPFAEPEPEAEFDPAPALSRLLDKLGRAALAELAKHAAERPVAPDFGLTLVPTVAHTLAWQDGAAAVEVAKLDVLEAELFVQNRARYLAPWLTDAQAAKLAKAPAGLAVVAAPATGKLAAGDLIAKVDGQPALPQTLARVRFLQTPAQLAVQRADGSSAEVVFP